MLLLADDERQQQLRLLTLLLLLVVVVATAGRSSAVLAFRAQPQPPWPRAPSQHGARGTKRSDLGWTEFRKLLRATRTPGGGRRLGSRGSGHSENFRGFLRVAGCFSHRAPMLATRARISATNNTSATRGPNNPRGSLKGRLNLKRVPGVDHCGGR
ncbi:unnamed protein product [Lampetra fluviatilis]